MRRLYTLVHSNLQRMGQHYFDPKLSLPVQAFNLLGCAGIVAALISALSCLLTGAGLLNGLINLAASVLAVVLLRYARRSNRYEFCYLLTVVLVFILAFPILFFSAGGYHSGMPCFFVFALTFTALMLDGRRRTLAITAEALLYISCILLAYYNPSLVHFFASERELMLDVIIGTAVASGTLLLAILLYIRIYNERQQQLETINQLKTQFMGDISHELKTPLTVISGYAQESRRALTSRPELSERMQLIASEADRLALIVSQMLDVTRIDEGRMQLNLQPAPLAQIVQSTLQTYYPVFSKNNNRLELARDNDNPTVLCEPHRITQILVNLISNAARHTHDGRIVICIQEVGNFAQISVSDNGEGIPPQRLKNLFERYHSFTGQNETRSGRETGTGLGLYICKHLVEAHGGEISVDSRVGEGTCVRFSLPLKK